MQSSVDSRFGSPAGAVFDCDGVLVDSEPASARAWAAALTELGHPADPEDFGSFIGRTDTEIAHHFGPMLEIDPITVDAVARRHFEGMAGSGLPTFPDALEVLAWLEARGRPVAVASNSSRRRLDMVLAAAGLAGRFPVTVAGDEVPNPKPAPDVFLAAVSRLELHPAACVCFEDSPAGIAGARSAGLRVVAVDRGVFDRTELEMAHVIADRLDPLDFSGVWSPHDPRQGSSDR